jgi:hypothetical protein
MPFRSDGDLVVLEYPDEVSSFARAKSFVPARLSRRTFHTGYLVRGDPQT